MSCGAVFNKLYSKMQEALSGSSEEESNLDVKCTFCTTLVRVEHFSNLKPGDHICMGGQNGMFNIGKHQVSFYKHHAIVKDIEHIDNSSAFLSMVHFTPTANDSDILIQETKDKKDLHYDEIYLVRYRQGTHPVDEILKRAESILKTKQTNYKFFQCNCEHFCQWCCIGLEESFQVQNFKETLQNIARAGNGNIASVLLKAATKLGIFSIDDLARATKVLIGVPWGVLSVAAFIYLIYCIYRHIKLNERLGQRTMCPSCCKQLKLELWSIFAVYCLTQAGGLGLVSFIVSAGWCSGGVVYGLIALTSILTLVLMWGIPKLIRAFKSPFAGKMVRVKTLKNIWVGDVISVKENYHLHAHDCVVSAVQIFPGTENKIGEIKIIHYSQHLLSKRKITEDVMVIDLNKDKVLGHVYTGYKVYSPEIVVKRARKRIGETKYGLMSNRSTHFCHWAKVDEEFIDDNFEDRPPRLKHFHRELDPNETISGYERASADHRRLNYATKTVNSRTARIREDIKAGQLIRFKYRGFPHIAVTTKVDFRRPKESVIKVTVIHYGKEKIVREEKITFNLNTDDVTIIRYHPVYRYGKEDIVKRARAKIGESKYSYFTRRSSHLAHEVVQKDVDQLASSMNDIKRGDIVTYYYWSLKHDAVVTNVRARESKANNKGHLTIVHYALPHLFATRTVQEETIFVDLSTDDVFVKGYEGFYTYNADNVVKRARNRIGEQRFSAIDNTSSDLSHWAKVIQEPSIVSEDSGKEKLIVPKITNKPHGKFQRKRVHQWSNLTPGTLVEFKYYTLWHPGILIEANEGTHSIKAIHYGADHIFADRTIMESTISVDLKNDTIWMYRADPKNCNKPDMIMTLAKERLGEQDWKSGNRSWDFCKFCILKK